MSLNHIHEVSSLYRTFRPNFKSYHSNGDGRDNYIQYNNGGFWNINPNPPSFDISHKNIHFHKNYSSSIRTPPFKYRSNGNGRDSYIIYNNGGLSYNNLPLKNCKLEKYLRTDYNFYKPFDFGFKKFVSKKEYIHNLMIKKKEKDVVDRLYNKEKYKFIKNNNNNNNSLNEKFNFKEDFNNLDMNKKYQKEMEKKYKLQKKKNNLNIII
jgi:hypothetical protein